MAAKSIAQIVPNLQEVRPTFMGAVPRVYEKIHTAVLAKLDEARVAKKRSAHITQRYRVTPVLVVEAGSALYAPTSLAFHESLHLGHVDAIEIAKYGVLETGGSSGELECALVVLIGDQPINESGRK